MTKILFQRVDGKPAGEPIATPRARRRLSTVVRRHVDRSRPHIVSVHRRQGSWKADPLAVTDMSVRLRKDWARVTVGPSDVVIITYLPAGGGRGASGNNRAAKGMQIGMLVATVALAAIGQFWAVGAINGALNLAAGSWVGGAIWGLGSAALLAGGAYLASQMLRAKANKTDDRPVYGVSGGGNLPRPADRIPIVFGTCWNAPDLSQPDYTIYDGDDQVLYKRLTVGVGSYEIDAIRLGRATVWTSAGGVQAPFIGAEVEIIPPGATSTLVPGSVASAQSVQSIELPYETDNPAWAGPFDFGAGAPQQTRIQLDFSLPEGVWAAPKSGKFEGKQFETDWGVLFEYAPADINGNPIGAWSELYRQTDRVMSTRALRFTRFVDVAAGRYVVRARNIGAPAEVEHPDGFSADIRNKVIWEGLRSHQPETIVRPHVTEVAIKIRSGKGLGVTAFANVEVRSGLKVPVWNGGGWTLTRTRKAVWAALHVLRDPIAGGGLPDSALDLARFRHYADTLTEHDTFDGMMRGPVSVIEAVNTILGVMRAEAIRLGRVWSLVRDEQKAVRRHVFSRRQIMRDSSSQRFNLDLSDGAADIMVEWLPDADPNVLRQARKTFGTVTTTPRRMQATGASDGAHAISIATWAAATAYFRREYRTITVELAGRLVLPGDRVMIDVWFFDALQSAGVRDRDELELLLDQDVTLTPDSYAVLRGRDGRAWGPVKISAAGPRTLTLDADDVAVAEANTGVTLAGVIATDSQNLTTVAIGDLTTLQEAYLVKTIKPTGRDRHVIEAVFDAPEVWSALGEAIVPPAPPPSSGLEGDPIPIVPFVTATAVQRAAALFVDWTVGRARGNVTYVVTISYDNWATSEEAYRGPASSGSYQIRDAAPEVFVRAYAISEVGIIGPTVQTSFVVRPVVVSGSTVALRVDVPDLLDRFRKEHEWYPVLHPDLLALSWQTAMQALSADGRAEASIRRVEEVNVSQTEARATLAQQTLARFETNEATSTLMQESISTLTSATATLTTQVNANTSGLSSLSGTVTSHSGAITSLNDAVAVHTTQIAAKASQGDLIAVQSTVTSQGLAIADLAANKADASFAIAIDAKANAATAGGQLSFTAGAGPGGATSRITLRASTTAGGTMTDAGLMIDVIGGVGRVSVIGSRIVFLDNSGGNEFVPFYYESGKWRMNTALEMGSTSSAGTFRLLSNGFELRDENNVLRAELKVI